MHGSDRILSNVSLFPSLTLNYYCIIAFIIIKILARVFVVINNDAQALTDGLSRLEPAVAGVQRLVGNFRPTCNGATALRFLAEPSIQLGGFSGVGSELELDGDVLTLEIEGRYLVNVDSQVLVLDFPRLVPTILQIVEGLRHWGFHYLH